MPDASERGRSSRATSRGRSSPSEKGATTSARAASRGREANSRGSSGGRKQSQSRTGSRTASRKDESANGTGKSTGSGDRQSQNPGSRDALTNIGISVLSATIGVAGGVLLGRAAKRPNRKVLGVPLPDKIDLGGVGQQIGEAGRQLGKLAGEVRAMREKAEQIGRVLT
jgi:hypothetical protein